MSNLKELTWKNHQNAERQVFVKELMGGDISHERYAIFLFNQYRQYAPLEQLAEAHNLLDVARAPAIWEDFAELWGDNPAKPTELPVVKDYEEHLQAIKDDPHKLMAHIYVRHLGDLSGGQIIKKYIPGQGRLYTFDDRIQDIKDTIRSRCDDSMADEAKLCFDFATQTFKEMTDLKNGDNLGTTH